MGNAEKSSDPTRDGGKSSTSKFVRILVLIGVGIPILIEAATFLRLIGGHLEEDGKHRRTSTEKAVYVVEGSELLSETSQTERIAEALITARDEAWIFELEIDVDNASTYPYELVLDSLTTQNGILVPGRSAQRWAPGESEEMEVEWRLAPGDLPARMTAIGRTIISADSVRQVRRRIEWGKIPVQRGRSERSEEEEDES